MDVGRVGGCAERYRRPDPMSTTLKRSRTPAPGLRESHPGRERIRMSPGLIYGEGSMEVHEITCRSLVNRTSGFLAGFTHTINPYHGCAYGKTLCGLPDYAPEIIRGFGERREWGTYLGVKINAPELYAADHDRIRASSAPAMRIYMSSVTDPYVPQERRYRITGRILEAMRERPPDLLALQTHTPNVLWDEDLVVDLSRRFPLSIQISVETDRDSLGPGFPKHAYPVSERIAALE